MARHGPIYRLRHRSGGCGGNSAQTYGGCSGGVSVAVRAPGAYFHYQNARNGYRQLPAAFYVGTHVKHPAGEGFPEGTGVIVSYAPDGYRVRCDKTGKILPVAFKESELTPVP